MGLTIQDMLSGDIVKRQAPQQDAMAGLGTLLQFLSQGQVQMPQMPALPESRPVDPSAFMHMMAQNKADKDAAEGAANARQLMGTPGEDRLPTPMLGAHDAVEGTGYLGGKISPQEVMAGLLSNKTTMPSGFAMLNDQFAPRAPVAPHYMEMGVPGKEGYRVNAVMTPNGPQAIGAPWKPSSGVTINNTDKIPPPSPGYMWNKDAESQYPIPGGPQDPNNKQPTQAEDTSTKFGNGMESASKRMNDALKKYNVERTSLADRASRVLGDGYGDIASQISNAIKSPDRRMLDQSVAEFRQFALTAMTGAAYSQDQKDDILRGMIPTDSDDPAAQAAKLEARDNFTRSMIQAGLPISKRTPASPKVPTGWNDELEAEYLKDHPEGK